MKEVKYYIPNELQADRYWSGALHIFANHPKLKLYMSQFIDFEELYLDEDGLERISRAWSPADKFMLRLALHLFNGKRDIDLSLMDRLDSNNKKIAFKAIQLRFAG